MTIASPPFPVAPPTPRPRADARIKLAYCPPPSVTLVSGVCRTISRGVTCVWIHRFLTCSSARERFCIDHVILWGICSHLWNSGILIEGNSSSKFPGRVQSCSGMIEKLFGNFHTTTVRQITILSAHCIYYFRYYCRFPLLVEYLECMVEWLGCNVPSPSSRSNG